MSVTALLPDGFKRERWANGLGESLVLAREPDLSDFLWRLSLVDIDSNAAYSAWPGFERSQVLLAGNGLKLRSGEREVALGHIGNRIDFAGEEVFLAELEDGPVKVFNGFARRGLVEMKLMLRPVNGRMLLTRTANCSWVGYLLRGGIDVRADGENFSLEAGFGFRIDAQAAPWAVIDGGGDLALAHIHLT